MVILSNIVVFQDVEGPYEDLPEGELPEKEGVGENTGGPSMSFYQKNYFNFIQIFPDFFKG